MPNRATASGRRLLLHLRTQTLRFVHRAHSIAFLHMIL